MSRNTQRPVLRTVVAVLAVVPALAGAASGTASASASAERGTGAKHVVTFAVPHCEACRFQVGHANADYSDTWLSQEKNVVDGTVRFVVPAEYADTLSATVVAPWEGPIGYVTQVVFRYTGHATGERVSVADARRQKRGTFCLKGDPDAAAVTVALRVKEVEVAGQTPSGRTSGTLAFASRTQAFAKPLSPLGDGVGGTQYLPACS